MSRAVPGSGAWGGVYPERVEMRRGRMDQWAAQSMGKWARRAQKRHLGLRRFIRAVNANAGVMERLASEEFKQKADSLRYPLLAGGYGVNTVSPVFALVREAAARFISLRHFDVQLMGGWILLHGMIAEMETGEGKTVVATLPACTAALAGLPVHIITVNDYLARRDAEWMKPVYEALGLTVGVITGGMDPTARRAAYACDVVYCTNKELGFDYLKDRILLGRNPSRLKLQVERLSAKEARMHRLLLRGLSYAIVDEADSVLVDEARTPLIISGGGKALAEAAVYETALSMAGQLESGKDFLIEERERTVELTPAGQERLEALAGVHGGLWVARLRREALVRQALTALHLMHRDTHYLVDNGTVRIIDEYTGRVMADRQWEHGLHQLVESKEGCAVTSPNEPLARISYQRLFRRYIRLSGMTGTAREVSGELWSVYRLPVVRVPTNRPLRRSLWRKRVFRNAAAKWEAVLASIEHVHEVGRPVLIGTRSVEASEHLSRILEVAGLPHRVLNARQDRSEAEIIAEAGKKGMITVATNMAGRGTDIRLEDGVTKLGGLHVIATEAHDARRIDRQLFGRCGRQGDPGSYEMIASLEDELLARHGSKVGGALARNGTAVSPPLGALLVHRAQRAAERLHARTRRDLIKHEERLETALAFSGRFE